MAWLHAEGRELVVGRRTRRLILCWSCPCCRPMVIGSCVTNGRNEETRIWWLTGYQGDHIGFPGGRWRIRDVGEAHHRDRDADCTGTIYQEGTIDDNGRLVGLPEKFVSDYSYNGYMELQQGCVMPDGSVRWPCPNG
ncbi:MAG: hypothetical protein ACI4WT_11835 [Oligosphaeraceae bacterium]